MDRPPEIDDGNNYQDHLISEAVQGDKNALGKLLQLLKPTIYSVFQKFRINPQRYEDLAQDVAIKILRNLHRYREESSFKSWVYSITRNHATDFIRYWRIRKEDLEFDGGIERVAPTGDPSPENILLQNEGLTRIERALSLLSEGHRAAVLGIIQGKKYEEIAKEQDIPAATVGTRLYYAKKELTQILGRSE